MVRTKDSELSVFKGREAKLNRVIFQILKLKGPQTIYDMHKQIKRCRGLKHTYYPNVNKRMRTLEQTGYLKMVTIQCSKAGGEKAIYELTARAYLALKLDPTTMEELLSKMSEEVASEILAAIAGLT